MLGNGEKPLALLIDVDGVMTDGKFYYSEAGKVMKAFGPDDHDAISLLRPYLDIHFLTGDKRGLSISQARIELDMQMPLHLVSTVRRLEWISERWNPAQVIYIGDGIFDHYVFEKVGYAIAPADADDFAKASADYVTKRQAGQRAVAEACIHLLDKFFEPYNRSALPSAQIKLSNTWGT